MDQKKKTYLEGMAKEIRRQVIKAIGEAGQGHVGGCLSIADILAVLYFDEMKVNPADSKMEGRDRFVLSKGHAGPALYSALALAGFFDVQCLASLNKPNTELPSHCDMNKTKGVDMTAGSLGQGISCAVGIALAAKRNGSGEYVYVIIGDGESQEGSVWEASMAASHFQLDNLIVFLDNNNLQIDGTVDEIMSLANPAAKWEAFGFKTYQIDGNDVPSVSAAIAEAKKEKDGRPAMIVAKTIKGKGVSFIEAEGAASHSMSLNEEQLEKALAELDGKVN